MEISLAHEIPETFQPLLLNEDRFLILKGSGGSGKSVFASKKLVFRTIYENYQHRHLVLRKVQTDIEESIYSEILARIREWGLDSRMYFRAVKKPYKIWLKDSLFIFLGLDDKERVKSISNISSITMEEMTEFSEDDFDQLNLRLRGEMPIYKQTMGMFNPVDENHWIKRRFVDNTPVMPTTFHESTYLDNPFIDDDYKKLLEGYKETNTLYYQIYCLGDWGVVDKSNKFLYAFEDHHIQECTYDSRLPVHLSFDFNIEPYTVQVYQKPDDNTIEFIDKVRLNDSDIYQVCDHILAKYPGAFFIVTGDATGNNRTGMVRGKTSHWRIIKEELVLMQTQIKVRTVNLEHTVSRVLCNSALQHRTVKIAPHLKELIKDCKYAKVDEYGKLIKDRKDNKLDDFDGFRYALDCEFKELIYKPKNK